MFKNKLVELMEERKSNLCIGLDPSHVQDPEDMLEFCKGIIEMTSDFAAAFKPNRQFLLGLTTQQMQSLTRKIHDNGCLSIMDHKLSDIGHTNMSAINFMKREGHDFFTLSPFPGNAVSTSEYAHNAGLGTIVLTLMSNLEASWMINGMYKEFARQSQVAADGMVVGSTNHVTEVELKEIAKIAPDPFILAPGIGAQGGSSRLLADVFGPRVLFSASRSIIYSQNPSKTAEDLLKNLLP